MFGEEGGGREAGDDMRQAKQGKDDNEEQLRRGKGEISRNQEGG